VRIATSACRLSIITLSTPGRVFAFEVHEPPCEA
jgi:hypothetical protein